MGYDVSGEMPVVNAVQLFRSLFNVDFGREINNNLFYYSDTKSRRFCQIWNHELMYIRRNIFWLSKNRRHKRLRNDYIVVMC